MKKPKAKTRNTWAVAWHGRIVDAGDGSGDGILELPDELMAQLGWKIGDILEIDSNTAKELILRKSEMKIISKAAYTPHMPT